jgi:hypothetical protein
VNGDEFQEFTAWFGEYQLLEAHLVPCNNGKMRKEGRKEGRKAYWIGNILHRS